MFMISYLDNQIHIQELSLVTRRRLGEICIAICIISTFQVSRPGK